MLIAMYKERYKKGAHTTLDLQYHCVWKTKYGYPVLQKELSLGVRRIVREIAVFRCLKLRINPEVHRPAAATTTSSTAGGVVLKRDSVKFDVAKDRGNGASTWMKMVSCRIGV